MARAQMKIIDPHHHLWDLERLHYPWLAEPVAHIVGDYSAIRRSYPVAEFLTDAKNQDLVASVHVQAEFDHDDDPVKETAWLQSVADGPESRGFPHGIVAYADLAASNVEDLLARHRQYPNIRGIRQMLNHAPEAGLCFVARGDLMRDARWRAGFALLETFGLSFDLQLWPWQMNDAATLARDFPNIQIILNHTGMPICRDRGGLEHWRHGMRALAEPPNVAVKLSGLGMFDHNWTTDSIRPFVLETIGWFGVERCMFASNFPVDKLMGSYDELWKSFAEIAASFSEAEQRKLFHDNAARYYRL
ncbi:MAG: amidohydrolase family protein [Kiloniellaceae bacterium]